MRGWGARQGPRQGREVVQRIDVVILSRMLESYTFQYWYYDYFYPSAVISRLDLDTKIITLFQRSLAEATSKDTDGYMASVGRSERQKATKSSGREMSHFISRELQLSKPQSRGPRHRSEV